MTPSHKVIKFCKIAFDPNWKLVSTTDQLFVYSHIQKGAGLIQVAYEAPQGTVFTTILECPSEHQAIIHRDVLHVFAGIIRSGKGDLIKS